MTVHQQTRKGNSLKPTKKCSLGNPQWLLRGDLLFKKKNLFKIKGNTAWERKDTKVPPNMAHFMTQMMISLTKTLNETIEGRISQKQLNISLMLFDSQTSSLTSMYNTCKFLCQGLQGKWPKTEQSFISWMLFHSWSTGFVLGTNLQQHRCF